jgi:hypothetical protein
MPTDDKDVLPSTPYTKMRTFAGIFEAGDRETPPLSIEVAYSLTNDHPPTGIIRGTSADYRDLEAFFLAQRGAGCSLRSASKEREKIVCDGIRLHRITEHRFANDEQSTIQQVLGRFSIDRIDIRTKFNSPATERRREATFLLTGPPKLWLIHASQTLSYTGELSVRHPDPALPLEATRDHIFTEPHFVYGDYRGAKGGAFQETLQAQLFSIRVLDAFETERDGAAFVEDSSALVDKLCLLMSFLSKTYISWFTCTTSDGQEFLQSYRKVRTTDSEAPDWEELVLNPNEIRLFLNQAFTGYNRRTAEGFDLRLPMLYYIWAQSSRFVEDRFRTLFFALEKLLSSLDERTPEEDFLTRSELSKLWKVMCPALEGMGKTPDQIELVLAKRGELLRAPLMHRLRRHLGALDIDVTDIGGPTRLNSMVGVRNHLTHEKGEPPIETVVRETRRLETIVERMLLKLLSWSGKNRTPTYYNRSIDGEAGQNAC